MADIHLDTAVLAGLQDIMEAEYPLLLDTFIADSDERLRLLHAALANRDAHELRLAAHSFKGSCSNMGAPALAQLCKQLEDDSHANVLDDAPQVLERIEREFAIVRILLKTERQRFSSL